jgi:hypothetical protein
MPDLKRMSEGNARGWRGKGQTGPKTAAGQQRSAGNARKHGLAAKKPEATSAVGRIGELAAALAAEFLLQNAAEDLVQQAAESQHDIEQVRQLKAEVLAKALLDRAVPPGEASGAAVQTVSLDWQRLERYERRAFKRRQQAFLKINALETTSCGKATSSRKG